MRFALCRIVIATHAWRGFNNVAYVNDPGQPAFNTRGSVSSAPAIGEVWNAEGTGYTREIYARGTDGQAWRYINDGVNPAKWFPLGGKFN